MSWRFKPKNKEQNNTLIDIFVGTFTKEAKKTIKKIINNKYIYI